MWPEISNTTTLYTVLAPYTGTVVQRSSHAIVLAMPDKKRLVVQKNHVVAWVYS